MLYFILLYNFEQFLFSFNLYHNEVNMSILLTGGAGYIGSTVASILKDEGEEVIILDNLTRSKKEYLPNGIKFYEGDIDDISLLEKIYNEEKIDAIMHFAAFIEVGESVIEPYRYYENNFSKAIKFFNYFIEKGIKKIIFSSTAAVYGEPQYIPIDENHIKNPTNPYGMSKLFVERFLESVERSSDVYHVALRYFNASGAYHNFGENHKPETHLIPIILEVALGLRDKIFINGDDYDTVDGTCIRDYIHVYDIAKAHLLAYRYLSNNKQSLKVNLGSGEGYSILDIIESCRKVTGAEIPVEIRERRDGDPSTLIASSNTAEAVLGWRREYLTVDAIIESAWKYHKEKFESSK